MTNLPKRKGSFYTDTNERIQYCIYKFNGSWSSIIRSSVAKTFSLKALGDVDASWDDSCQEYLKNSVKISLDWSIWEGFVVRAANPDGNNLVKQIADYLDNLKINFEEKPGFIKRHFGIR